jgi:signal transduction histidine kinase/integral membrane sensor domain MASE1
MHTNFSLRQLAPSSQVNSMAVEDLRPSRTPLRLVGLGMFVAAAYYAGAVVGLMLKLPEATPSVMWPPNSILTSVLLLTRPAWWPIVLLSALPPHVALESGAGWPTTLVLALFATNCSEALMAAGGLRWLSDEPTRFDSIHRVGVFVGVVVIAAPALSSVLDAWAVSSIGTESFVSVWRSRLLSNSLSALTVVPAFVMVGTSGLVWLREATRGQYLEAALLAAFILVMGTLLVQSGASSNPDFTVLAETAGVSWFLPLLVWAALRFGPGGTSVALLAATLFLVGAAVRTDGPFRGLPPPETTRALQLFLLPVSQPLLAAAALVEERRQSGEALRASEATNSDILASLTMGVVVLDRHGRIVTANDSWRHMAHKESPSPPVEAGDDYIEFYRALARAGKPWAAEAAAGVEAVTLGASREFWIDSTTPSPEGERTIVIRAVPLHRDEGGAVVAHTDISEQRSMQHQVQRARAELAHVARVSTVGALTASIAHQLNQPLAGILTNAQAATRLLGGDPPDLDEARASLRDIVEDDRRASEVILRMRELLRHDSDSLAELDINGLVSDVVRLLSSDAIIRNVDLVLRLDPVPAVVQGDSVKLQQVVLNLILNALEAVAEHATADRRVIVRSRVDRDVVEVSVVDRGMGFSGAEERAFEPFFTTKRAGMGLGLYIAKSIVQAHEGLMHATTNREGGATVSFSLPLAHPGAA